MKYFLFFAMLFPIYTYSKPHSSECYELKTSNQKIILSIHLYNKEKTPSIKKIIEPTAGVLWHGYSIPRIGISIREVKTIKIPAKSEFEVEFDITDRYDYREGLHDYTFDVNNDMIHKEGSSRINFKFNNSFRKPHFTDNPVISPPKL